MQGALFDIDGLTQEQRVKVEEIKAVCEECYTDNFNKYQDGGFSEPMCAYIYAMIGDDGYFEIYQGDTKKRNLRYRLEEQENPTEEGIYHNQYREWIPNVNCRDGKALRSKVVTDAVRGHHAKLIRIWYGPIGIPEGVDERKQVLKRLQAKIAVQIERKTGIRVIGDPNRDFDYYKDKFYEV